MTTVYFSFSSTDIVIETMSVVGVGEIGNSRGFYFNFLGMKRGEGGGWGVVCMMSCLCYILFFDQYFVIGALLILMFLPLLPCFFLPLIQTFHCRRLLLLQRKKISSCTLLSSSFRNSDCHDQQDSFKRKALAALVPVRHLDSA